MNGLPVRVRIFAHASASLVLAFLMLPILIVVPASLNESAFVRVPPQSLSLTWYEAFLSDREWMNALWNSIVVGFLTTAFAVAAGTAAVLGIQSLPVRLRALLFGLFLAPLVVPTIVTAVAIYRTALDLHINSTVAGLVLSHTVLALPFVVLNVGIALRAVDQTWLQAAAGLGATPLTIFRTITLPTIVPGIVGSVVFAFTTSFDEFTISLFMVGYQTKTLPVKIWEAVRLEFTPVVAVASTAIILLAALLFVAAVVLSRKQAGARA